VLTISRLPLSCENNCDRESAYSTMYLLSEASTAGYYIMDICDGSYKKVVSTVSALVSLSTVHFAEIVDQGSTIHTFAAVEKLNDLEERKLLQSDACLVLHSSLQQTYTSATQEIPQHTILYLIDRSSQLVLQIAVILIPNVDNFEVSIWERLSLKVSDSAPLTLSGRAIGMGHNSATHELAVIGENKHVYLYFTSTNTLTLNSIDSPIVATSLPRLLDYQNTVVFLIHKPLGVLSSAKDYDSAPRGKCTMWRAVRDFR